MITQLCWIRMIYWTIYCITFLLEVVEENVTSIVWGFMHNIISSVLQVQTAYLAGIKSHTCPTQSAWEGAVDPPVGWCHRELLLPLQTTERFAESWAESQVSRGRRCSALMLYQIAQVETPTSFSPDIRPHLGATSVSVDCSNEGVNPVSREDER